MYEKLPSGFAGRFHVEMELQDPNRLAVGMGEDLEGNAFLLIAHGSARIAIQSRAVAREVVAALQDMLDNHSQGMED